MFNNRRYPIALLVLGFIGGRIGWIIRVLHWPGGPLISGSMLIVQVIALGWLVILLSQEKK